MAPAPLRPLRRLRPHLGVSKKSVPGTGRHFDVRPLVTPSLQTSKSRTQTFWTHQPRKKTRPILRTLFRSLLSPFCRFGAGSDGGEQGGEGASFLAFAFFKLFVIFLPRRCGRRRRFQTFVDEGDAFNKKGIVPLRCGRRRRFATNKMSLSLVVVDDGDALLKNICHCPSSLWTTGTLVNKTK